MIDEGTTYNISLPKSGASVLAFTSPLLRTLALADTKARYLPRFRQAFTVRQHLMKLTSILFLLILTLQQAFACTCARKPSIKDNWAMASHVFTGQVISLDSSDRFRTADGASVTLYNIRILESFKPKFRSDDTLRTFASYLEPGSCDMYFIQGQKYLIYAASECPDCFLKTSACLRTTLLSRVEESEIVELRKMHQEKTALYEKYKAVPELDLYEQLDDKERELSFLKEAQDQSTKSFTTILAVCLLTICVLVILLLILWRRRIKTIA